MRVWLDDRPGALGAVASRIGAVRGDLVGIEILERGANRAIDELIVEIPSADLLELLVREVHEVDGVDVEEVREWRHDAQDIRLAPLEIATKLLEDVDPKSIARTLVTRSIDVFDLGWAAVVSSELERAVAQDGDCPNDTWIHAFVKGGSARASLEGFGGGTDEILMHGLDYSGWVLVASREQRPFRALERSQLWMLCRIAGQYATQLDSSMKNRLS